MTPEEFAAQYPLYRAEPLENYDDLGFESDYVECGGRESFYEYLEFDSKGNIIGMREPEINITPNYKLDSQVLKLEDEYDTKLAELYIVKRNQYEQITYNVKYQLNDTIQAYTSMVNKIGTELSYRNVNSVDDYLEFKSEINDAIDRLILMKRTISVEMINAHILELNKDMLETQLKIDSLTAEKELAIAKLKSQLYC
jgi:hypothetical protein